jgi:hypothetical protein
MYYITISISTYLNHKPILNKLIAVLIISIEPNRNSRGIQNHPRNKVVK